jgi:hypothetical protein
LRCTAATHPIKQRCVIHETFVLMLLMKRVKVVVCFSRRFTMKKVVTAVL